MWPDMTKSSSSVHPDKDDIKPITQQPSSHKSRRKEHVEDIPSIPEGLDALEKTEHLFIKQSVFSSLETQYEVLNSDGEKIFMADETTDTMTKAWCRGTKPFDVSILIRSGMYRKEVMKMDGEPRSCGCGGDITLRSTRKTLGVIEHGTEFSFPNYVVRDSEGNEILKIVGPPSKSCLSFTVDPGAEFDVLSPDEKSAVGKIAKYWADQHESSSLRDIWGVKFPLEMNVTTKALLLAACFLLNFQYQNIT